MKSAKYILFTLMIFIIGSSIYIATVDAEYDIKQSRILKAPIEVVFNEVNDFKNWKNWGPWYELDSTIVASFENKTSGVGASYSWTGKEGEGTMKTVSVIPNKELIQEINFGTGSNPEVYWNFNENSNGTEVTWGMKGKSTFTEKIYWLFKGGIEKNMTPMYERGLVLLDTHLENEMNSYSIEHQGIVEFGGGFYMYKTSSSKIDEISLKTKDMFSDITNYMNANTIEPFGNHFVLFHRKDEQNGTAIFSTCVPIVERVVTQGEILTALLKPQKAFKTILKGDYKHLKLARENANKELQKQGLIVMENGEPFEIYKITSNDTRNPSKWITEIYIPIY